MEMSRRGLLAVPFSLWPPSLLAREARAEGRLRLDLGPEGAVLTGDGVADGLAVPGEGARLLPGLVLGRVAVSVIRFRLGAVDWAVFAVRRGDAVWALALEPLEWRGAGGARMATRVSAAGGMVVLRRDSAMAESATLWRREGWTDYLRWEGGRLLDAPVRAAPEGTRQAVVGEWRRRAAGVVAAGAVSGTAMAAAGLGELRLAGVRTTDSGFR